MISRPSGLDKPYIAGKAGISCEWKGNGSATKMKSVAVSGFDSMKEKESWVMLPALA